MIISGVVPTISEKQVDFGGNCSCCLGKLSTKLWFWRVYLSLRRSLVELLSLQINCIKTFDPGNHQFYARNRTWTQCTLKNANTTKSKHFFWMILNKLDKMLWPASSTNCINLQKPVRNKKTLLGVIQQWGITPRRNMKKSKQYCASVALQPFFLYRTSKYHLNLCCYLNRFDD